MASNCTNCGGTILSTRGVYVEMPEGCCRCPQGERGIMGLTGPVGPTGPTGIQGPAGIDGRSVVGVSQPAAGTMYLVMSRDGDIGPIVLPPGPTGPQGPAGTMAVDGLTIKLGAGNAARADACEILQAGLTAAGAVGVAAATDVVLARSAAGACVARRLPVVSVDDVTVHFDGTGALVGDGIQLLRQGLTVAGVPGTLVGTDTVLAIAGDGTAVARHYVAPTPSVTVSPFTWTPQIRQAAGFLSSRACANGIRVVPASGAKLVSAWADIVLEQDGVNGFPVYLTLPFTAENPCALNWGTPRRIVGHWECQWPDSGGTYGAYRSGLLVSDDLTRAVFRDPNAASSLFMNMGSQLKNACQIQVTLHYPTTDV